MVSLSVIIPVHNEQESIGPLMRDLEAQLDRIPQASEVVVVDDGSTDGTAAVLDRLRLESSRLRVLRLRRNFGQTSAMAAGFHAARGDVFITTSSLTKSYGLSSLRAGWVIASPAITYRVRRARDVVDGTGSIVAERLAVLAFEHLDALYLRARAILARNKALADAFLQSRRELEWVPSPGTIVFPRIKGTSDAGPFIDRVMREHRTALGPGAFFDAPAHFRLGYGGDTEKIREGLSRVGTALDAVA